MEIDMAMLRKENVKSGSSELISLNKALKSARQAVVQMNADQLVVFHLWLQTKS